jgi:hypothetical protein
MSRVSRAFLTHSVIENKDAVKALNVIHESCLTIPTSPDAESLVF